MSTTDGHPGIANGFDKKGVRTGGFLRNFWDDLRAMFTDFGKIPWSEWSNKHAGTAIISALAGLTIAGIFLPTRQRKKKK
jgi:hypothetical protein